VSALSFLSPLIAQQHFFPKAEPRSFTLTKDGGFVFQSLVSSSLAWMRRMKVVLPLPQSPCRPMVKGVQVSLAAMIRAKVSA
jgi:hypothetical protein